MVFERVRLARARACTNGLTPPETGGSLTAWALTESEGSGVTVLLGAASVSPPSLREAAEARRLPRRRVTGRSAFTGTVDTVSPLPPLAARARSCRSRSRSAREGRPRRRRRGAGGSAAEAVAAAAAVAAFCLWRCSRAAFASFLLRARREAAAALRRRAAALECAMCAAPAK